MTPNCKYIIQRIQKDGKAVEFILEIHAEKIASALQKRAHAKGRASSLYGGVILTKRK